MRTLHGKRLVRHRLQHRLTSVTPRGPLPRPTLTLPSIGLTDTLVDSLHIERLQGTPIFGALKASALSVLLERTRMVAVPEGGYYFREDDPASSMFVLEAGRAVVVKGWQGRELPMRELAPGDCFGEMALMDLCPRSASIRALQPCTAIELTPADLHRLYEHDVGQFLLVQMNIGREVCRRLRLTDEMLFRARMGALPHDAPTDFGAI
jgi:CRP/FNR family transcriptional regulator, cyclic AMP receptor protein